MLHIKILLVNKMNKDKEIENLEKGIVGLFDIDNNGKLFIMSEHELLIMVKRLKRLKGEIKW